MKYDLIVVGGGPAGLTAAKTATEDGLKVLLIERKKEITSITRSCLQILYVRGISPLASGKTYMEPVTVDVGAETAQFNFTGPGFSVGYRGPIRPYLNWIQVSPSGHQVHRFKLNDKIWGFYYDKEAFLAGLLSSAEKAGVKVLRESSGIAAENTKTGVRILVREERTGRQKTFEAGNAVVAEGIISRINQSLGLEKKRKVISGKYAKGIWYIIEGLETSLPGSSLLTFTIPSFYARNVIIGMMSENRNSITAGPTLYEKLYEHPVFKPMLSNARVVKTLHFTNILRTPVREPVAGNVVIAGDSAAPTETWIQGAVACGYQAVKSIEDERQGRRGYRRYINWWQNAFSFNTPDYFRILSEGYALNRECNDEELDYVFSLLRDRVGIPAVIVDEILPIIRKDRPDIYRKLTRRKEKSMWQPKKD